MTSQLQINTLMTSLQLSILCFICVHADVYDDFKELKEESEVGFYTSGYFKNREDVLQGLKNLNGSIIYKDDLLWFTCRITFPRYRFHEVFPRFRNTVYPKRIAIQDCDLAPSPLADAFRDLNINVPTIEFLQIASVHITEPIPKADYMEGLDLKYLFIDFMFSGDMFAKNPEFLKPLTNLTILSVWGCHLPKLPDDIHLEVMSFRHDTKVKKWTNCKSLRTLSVSNVMPDQLPLDQRWPEECQNLTKIRLWGMSNTGTKYIMGTALSRVSVKLEVLYMRFCNQSNPPYRILHTAKNLKHLNLTGNRIEDETLIEIPLMKSLTNLDLSRNFLDGKKLFDLVKQVPNLRYLNLEGNKFWPKFCIQTDMKAVISKLALLQRLSLENVPIGPDCFKNSHFPELQYLNLALTRKMTDLLPTTPNTTEAFDLRDLPTTDAKRLQVDLRGRQINFIKFNSEDYFALRKGYYDHLWGSKRINNRHHRPQLIIYVNTTEYNCHNHWFCLALMEYPDLITSPDFKCPKSKDYFLEENSNCVIEYQKGCEIRRDNTDDKGVILSCDSVDNIDWKELSELYRITQINITNSHITTLNDIHLPETLKNIYMAGNNLTALDDANLGKLFTNSSASMMLSNNMFNCDCELVKQLHRKNKLDKVQNFDEITCVDQNEVETLLYQLDLEELCAKKTVSYSSVWIAIASVVIVIKITFLLCWYYNNYLKRFMYKLGCCHCCLKKEEDAVFWETVAPDTRPSQLDLVGH